MAEKCKIVHKPTLAYAPWSNGTIERLNRDLIAAMRAVLAETKIPPIDSPDVTGMVQTVLNEGPLERLGKNADGSMRSPLDVMTRIKPRRIEIHKAGDYELKNERKTMKCARSEQLINIEKLQESLNIMHKDVGERISNRKQKAIESHNKAANIVLPRFEPGDFVIVRSEQKGRHKMSLKWPGPRRIKSTLSMHVYLVENLSTGKLDQVHCARIAPYEFRLEGKEVSKEIMKLADRTESRYEILETIIDTEKSDGELWLQLQWDGLPDHRDWTWSKLTDVFEDVPKIVSEFLAATRPSMSRISCIQFQWRRTRAQR